MILDRILASKRAEVTERRERRPLGTLQSALPPAGERRDFLAALQKPEFGVIAEIKRRSPARGLLRRELDPRQMARVYERAGACALSVLTDGPFFDGTDEDLRAARAASTLPALRKDFVIDPYQVWEAAALGADAALLIVRALERKQLGELHALVREIGLAALVEVHSEAELECALDAGVHLVGVNNRNLDTLEVDIATTERLAPMIPASVTFIAESGVSNRAAAERMHAAGARAILVGEALVLSDDPGELLGELSLQTARAGQ